MTAPLMGLNAGDPRQLGAFRLEGRVHESALGVVYAGRDREGGRVEVAVLDAGAVADPRARERFADAVRADPRVLSARTKGRSVLWVAVAGEGPDAAEFLTEAGTPGRTAGRGPTVMPHWAGSRAGTAVPWEPWSGRRDSAVEEGRGNWWLIGGLGAVLLLILALVALLYWFMLQFPQPEMPAPGQPVPEEGPSSGPGEDPSAEPEDDGEGEEPAVPVFPSPGEGEGGEGWGEDPQDNL
ncbi:hypothetical protein PWG71_15650 [Nocardiopsis sp. N85]|uniref:hypothetical protein n=1 Tax=Nocardiopsis sp. N85 TaxID=3029400 RepID=UPI00237F8B91|nr:hypothetical protein [Nocardiopsis sp. N85]MDE3722823.1 hypothetical protein [Nocardiopsis sp. N85]